MKRPAKLSSIKVDHINRIGEWGRLEPWSRAPKIDIFRQISQKQINWCLRASKGGCPTKAPESISFTNLWVGCAPAWGIPVTRRWRKCVKIANLYRLPGAGVAESHVHDVSITKEAPNYRS